MATKIDPRLTHIILVDSGQWAKGKTRAEALAKFRELHSSRALKHAQVWAVTENMRINEFGSFAAPRAEFLEPIRIA